jgi:hypothetical protein
MTKARSKDRQKGDKEINREERKRRKIRSFYNSSKEPAFNILKSLRGEAHVNII